MAIGGWVKEEFQPKICCYCQKRVTAVLGRAASRGFSPLKGDTLTLAISEIYPHYNLTPIALGQGSPKSVQFTDNSRMFAGTSRKVSSVSVKPKGGEQLGSQGAAAERGNRRDGKAQTMQRLRAGGLMVAMSLAVPQPTFISLS